METNTKQNNKDVSITRMNAITQSREFLACRTNCDYTAQEWIRLASVLTEYIQLGETDEVNEKLKKIDTYFDKKKKKQPSKEEITK
jgi:hypothetical protein